VTARAGGTSIPSGHRAASTPSGEPARFAAVREDAGLDLKECLHGCPQRTALERASRPETVGIRSVSLLQQVLLPVEHEIVEVLVEASVELADEEQGVPVEVLGPGDEPARRADLLRNASPGC
jgi:hypothetical protein